MNDPTMVAFFFVSGKPEREEMERGWLDSLAKLRDSPISQIAIELLSPWEVDAPWKNRIIAQFVGRAHVLFKEKPIIGCKRFPLRRQWMRPGYLECGTNQYNPYQWVKVFDHIEAVRRMFRCLKSWISSEVHGDWKDTINLPGSDRKRLLATLEIAMEWAKKAGLPLPTWARPGSAGLKDDGSAASENHLNWLFGLIGRYAMSDDLHFSMTVPDGREDGEWRNVPTDRPFQREVYGWPLQIVPDDSPDRGLKMHELKAIDWAANVERLSTPTQRLPQKVFVFADVTYTQWFLDQLAQWKAA